LTRKAVSPRALGEAELIGRILRGERKLFHELVRPYERAVYVTAFAVLRNVADAEDAAQETMLKALTQLKQLSSPEKFRPWLLHIAMNEARLKRRSRRNHLYESLDFDREAENDFMPRDFADWREIPPETFERKEIRQMVSRALEELPPIYREIFVLRDVQQLNVSDCMQILEVSEEVVKIRLHRARLMMREKLAPAFRRGFLARWLSLRGKNPWSAANMF
jgi:RNA polymerase sigma-70 factor (ECF subfamily)